jgi:hypothetical protein
MNQLIYQQLAVNESYNYQQLTVDESVDLVAAIYDD